MGGDDMISSSLVHLSSYRLSSFIISIYLKSLVVLSSTTTEDDISASARIGAARNPRRISRSVFDVTKGKSHYGVGGGYHHFAGRDASRAFIAGNFTGDELTDSLHDLSSSEVKSIVEWRDFYFRSYTYVGKLVCHYYDSNGNPTKYLKGVEAKAGRGAQLLEKQKKEEAKQPSCNSWSQEEGGQVWCDTGDPRLVQSLKKSL